MPWLYRTHSTRVEIRRATRISSSVRLKPSAKSSRSCGVAIMTDVRDAVVDDGHGRLLGHGLDPLEYAALFPAPGGDLEQRLGVAQPEEAQRVLHLSHVFAHGRGSSRVLRAVARRAADSNNILPMVTDA